MYVNRRESIGPPKIAIEDNVRVLSMERKEEEEEEEEARGGRGEVGRREAG